MRIFEMSCRSSERKKWVHYSECITSIIFCTALSDYDRVGTTKRVCQAQTFCLIEVSHGGHATQNRMVESLDLFDSLVNSQWFLRTSIILILNKVDIFRRKLSKIPLERYFQEYIGGPGQGEATKYILSRFKQVNRAQLSVYSQ